jgi:DNA-binding PadR family transcriptional regulator
MVKALRRVRMYRVTEKGKRYYKIVQEFLEKIKEETERPE